MVLKHHRALRAGADDYVVKPYSVLELMSRARVQLRRVRPATVGVVLILLSFYLLIDETDQ